MGGGGPEEGVEETIEYFKSTINMYFLILHKVRLRFSACSALNLLRL